jgi:lipid A oxidase
MQQPADAIGASDRLSQAPGAEWPEKAAAVLAAVTLAVAAGPLLTSTGSGNDRAVAARPPAGVPEVVSAQAETIIAGYGGITHTHSSDVHFSKPGVTDLTAHGVDWIGRPFKSPIYYGLRAIRWPEASRTGGMVDFTHAKAISVREQSVRFSGTRNGQPADATRKMGDTFRHLEFSHGHNMLTLNGMFRLGALAPTIRPYVGAGVGVSLPHTEVQFRDEAKRTYEYQMTGGVGQVLAGIELRLPRVSVFVEYKLSIAPYGVPLSARDGSKGNAFIDYWAQFRQWWRGEEPESGRLTTTLASHHLIGGVGYRHLGPAPAQ